MSKWILCTSVPGDVKWKVGDRLRDGGVANPTEWKVVSWRGELHWQKIGQGIPLKDPLFSQGPSSFAAGWMCLLASPCESERRPK